MSEDDRRRLLERRVREGGSADDGFDYGKPTVNPLYDRTRADFWDAVTDAQERAYRGEPSVIDQYESAKTAKRRSATIDNSAIDPATVELKTFAVGPNGGHIHRPTESEPGCEICADMLREQERAGELLKRV